ncbi:uncharacterized protein LOC117788055 [Drosophila innubila]|uniref:uncharacterized protein LOC117788055 n=1 Tax=Drosophila innubila TaxID=198719 RepID=UPI00148E8260|nr:uncharacterized protein LOC117788055 [Drosophila innubila]
MEQYVKTQLAKAVVQEAVDQCNEIENSLEGCLKVLQKIRLPHLTDDSVMTESQRELCGKRSYTVCVGKKYPELIEINDADELTEDSHIDNLIKYAGRKLQSILKTQESILQRLDIVEKKIRSTDQIHF